MASPDQIRGEIVKAFVILAPGYQPSEQLMQDLQEHVKRVTAPYKYPREIEFTTELPKTISGKIRRWSCGNASATASAGTASRWMTYHCRWFYA